MFKAAPGPEALRRGFTLLETLVALSIIVLVLGAAYGSYAAATASVARCRARASVERDARVLLRRIEREVRCVAWRPPETAARKGGAPATLSEGPARLFIEGGSDPATRLLHLLTFAGRSDPEAPGSGQYAVTYRYESAHKRLRRRQTDRMAETKEEDNGSWLCVAQGVEEVRVAFFDGDRWAENWDTKKESELPAAVRVALTLNDADGRPHLFAAVFDVPVRPPKTRETRVERPAETRAAEEAPAPVTP